MRLGWYFNFPRSTDKIQFFDKISSSGKIKDPLFPHGGWLEDGWMCGWWWGGVGGGRVKCSGWVGGGRERWGCWVGGGGVGERSGWWWDGWGWW